MTIRSAMILCLWVATIGKTFADGPGDSMFLKWAREFSPVPSSGVDSPNAVTTDAQGNIYVTGKSEGKSTDFDYLTIKYNSAGVEQWRARYDGAYHGADIPIAIAVDDVMSVYVTGTGSDSDSTLSDIVTIKYSPDGTEEWVVQYAGETSLWSGNGTNAPYDMAVDASHNVYVTGLQFTDSYSDFVTLKYNSSGILQWSVGYDGPVGGYDEARRVELDANGNIYVTGAAIDSAEPGWWGREYWSATTIKYGPDGNLIWLSKYLTNDTSFILPVDMKTGPDGSLYILANTNSSSYGWTDWSEDVIILKYTGDGSLLWARSCSKSPYGNPVESSATTGRSMTIDPEGNVYVTGGSGRVSPYPELASSMFVLKYDPNGLKQWFRSYDRGSSYALVPTGITLDPDGDVWIAGTHGHMSPIEFFNGDSTVLIRHSASGALISKEYWGGGDNTVCAAKAMTIAPNGHLLLASEVGLPDQTDIVLRSYSTDGSRNWAATASGPGTTTAFVTDAVVDANGNTYLTGAVARPGSHLGYLTMKIDSSGNVAWSATLDSIFTGRGFGEALAVNPDGSTLVMGHAVAAYGPLWGTAVIKYDSAGTELWRTKVDSIESICMKSDTDGSVYVGGSELVKLGQNGAIEWKRDPGYYYVRQIANGRNGTILAVTGDSLKQFDQDGNQMWSTHMESAALAVDDSGYIFVSRAYFGLGSTTKLTEAGEEVWTLPYGGTDLVLRGDNIYASGVGPLHSLTTQGEYLWSVDHPITWFSRNSITLDTQGSVYSSWTDYDAAGSGDLDIVTGQYSPEGSQSWTGRFDGTVQNSHRETAIGADSAGNIYVIGEHWTNSFTTVPVIAKYGRSSPPGQWLGAHAGQPYRFRLAPNYPNPFNPVTEVDFEIEETGVVNLQVYDVLGREVATLVGEVLQPGRYRRTFDGRALASGLYFCRLQSGSKVAVLKMMLLK